jgi:hypothetical protein
MRKYFMKIYFMILWQMNWSLDTFSQGTIDSTKINPQTMQTVRILQAVALMMVVALAASCAASKEYTAKIFGPRVETEKDSSLMAIKFLELDKLNPEGDEWVTTNIVAKDSASGMPITPAIATVKNNPSVIKDSLTKEPVTVPVADTKNPNPVTEEPVARTTTSQNGTRNKTTREK